jgi:hypothetical protein
VTGPAWHTSPIETPAGSRAPRLIIAASRVIGPSSRRFSTGGVSFRSGRPSDGGRRLPSVLTAAIGGSSAVLK